VKACPRSHQACAQRPGETSILVVLANHRGSLHEGPLKQGAAGRLINVAKVQSPSRAVVPANRPPGRTRSCRRIQAAAIAPRAGAAHRVRARRCSNGAAIGSKEPSGSSTIVNVGVDELGFPDFGPSMRWVCLDADDPQLLDGLAAPAPIKNSAPPRASADTGNHAGVGRGRTPAKRWPLGHPKTAARRPGAGKSLRAACPIPQTALSTNKGLGDEIRSRPPLACVPWRAARIGKS
jgi:hypothetical protein